jgi:hypothetical protein
MRTTARHHGAHALFGVALGAEAILRVARGAKAGIDPRLVGVTQPKARAMEPAQARPIEGEPRGERRYRDPMTSRAEGLAVARSAQVARARRSHAVLTHEVAFVDDVTRRPRELGGQVDVARLAVPRAEVVLVSVAAEALRHRRAEGELRSLSRGDVTRNALASERAQMTIVREAKMLAREACLLARMRATVTSVAGARVVRSFVAFDAHRALRKMEGTGIARLRNASVTGEARDSLERMGSVLEGVLGLPRFDAEHARAGRDEEGENDEENAPHRVLGRGSSA